MLCVPSRLLVRPPSLAWRLVSETCAFELSAWPIEDPELCMSVFVHIAGYRIEVTVTAEPSCVLRSADIFKTARYAKR